jgi:sugar phosphate isomerase/epimerase
MESIRDFEDMLELLEKHGVEYLIIGGLAFIYHAKPKEYARVLREVKKLHD